MDNLELRDLIVKAIHEGIDGGDPHEIAGRLTAIIKARILPEGDYEMLRDAVIALFNPPDKDEAEEAILIEALAEAAEFIRDQTCACTEDEPCPRCRALGER